MSSEAGNWYPHTSFRHWPRRSVPSSLWLLPKSNTFKNVYSEHPRRKSPLKLFLLGKTPPFFSQNCRWWQFWHLGAHGDHLAVHAVEHGCWAAEGRRGLPQCHSQAPFALLQLMVGAAATHVIWQDWLANLLSRMSHETLLLFSESDTPCVRTLLVFDW